MGLSGRVAIAPEPLRLRSRVTELEAEEMIFIADLKDNQYIDFTEFKQVVVSWSG